MPFERDFTLLRHFKKDNGLFIDVGANRGQSIDAIRMFVKDSTILAFEANPLLAQALTKRWKNSTQVVIQACGLAAHESSQTLYIPTYNQFIYDGLASFTKEEATSWLNKQTVAGFNPKKLRQIEVTCDAKTLDSFSVEPDFIKLDVQGFETEVLKGAENTVQRHKPLILLENNKNADALLVSWGFSRFAWDGQKLKKGQHGSLNTFYGMPETFVNWSLEVT